MGGVEICYIKASYIDSVYVPDWNLFFHTANTSGNLMMFQSFVNWKHKFTEQLQVVTGLHYQQVSLNNDLALEPRISMSWKFSERQEISLGYGLHSQAQPRTVYFSETLVDTSNLVYVQTNKELGFTRSHQAVVGYQVLFDSKHRLKSEIYFQKLFDVPVNTYPSQFSMINYGGSFTSSVYDSLVNKGDGWNMGVELTMERFFANNFYYLATISTFRQQVPGQRRSDPEHGL